MEAFRETENLKIELCDLKKKLKEDSEKSKKLDCGNKNLIR